MKSIATLALREGMILAEDVVSFQGKTLFREGTMVTKDLISRLERYSIMGVSIKDPEDITEDGYDRFHLSNSYRQFESIYLNSLNAYKYAVQTLFKEQTQINTSYLLTIQENVLDCFSLKAQVLTMLPNLNTDDDDKLYAHMLNAALISAIFGDWMKLPSKDRKLLILCGFFYDIGRLRIPAKRFAAAAKLSKEDEQLIRTHTMLGYDLLQYQNLNEAIRQCILHHHERCDGSGYPDGLTCDDIDPFSKYIAIIDTYEAMMSARIHGQKLTPFQIIRNMELQGKGKLDARALEIFLMNLARLQLGRNVRLSNAVIGEIHAISDSPSYPAIRQTDGTILNLSHFPELSVVEMLS